MEKREERGFDERGLDESDPGEAAEVEGVAVIGMSGRFPGARDLGRFWRNLREGKESVRFFDDHELRAAGVSDSDLADPIYVRAASVLDDVDQFDASFFGFNPREAQILDPQQRLFLEGCWEAIEDAGYDVGALQNQLVGVYGGTRISDYLMRNLYANPKVLDAVGYFQAVLANDKDYLATQVSYRLDLTGPSLTVQSACSTSLVAVHLASEALNNHECNLALAGGSTIRLPQIRGYHAPPEGIFSPDGHCRAFDHRANGTIFGNGMGVVLLKRLADALDDDDPIYAVIRGSSVNNDGGSGKVAYTAPAVGGQVRVVADAQSMADVDPAEIGYIECHGTGTALGDPIEITALNRVFHGSDAGRESCAIGSIKTNVGHLEAAAGIAGFLKTVLMIHHGEIVPSLHFEEPNPRIPFERTPFYVATETSPWKGSRIAGVSSFGIGGTNAHVILEEAPPRPARPAPERDVYHLLPLSTRGPESLERASERLDEALASRDLRPDDAAYTLTIGRGRFAEREIRVLRGDGEEAARRRGRADTHAAPVVFLLPGQGAQHAGMAADLYAREPLFRAELDRCLELLRPHLDEDPRPWLLADRDDEHAAAALQRTRFTQPTLFCVEYATAQWWMSRGVRPAALLGHSLGEYVAACLAGVFTLEQALELVAIRGRLMQAAAPGVMISVESSEEDLRPLLGSRLDLAAINAPKLCVASGPEDAAIEFEAELNTRGLRFRRLRTSHAFHSASMEPILGSFTRRVGSLRLNSPSIPVISNLTGRELQPNEATDPSYWARHLRETVRFADGVAALLDKPRIFLEVGPGRTLSTLVRRCAGTPSPLALQSMRPPGEEGDDAVVLLESLGRLWNAGVEFEAPDLGGRRVRLPTYPFERRRFWVDPLTSVGAESSAGEAESTESKIEEAAFEASSEQMPDGDFETETERLTAAIWSEVLGVETIERDDDFFELGGHSLLAGRVVGRVRDRFGLEMSLRELFARPKLSDVAEIIERARGDETSRASMLPPIEPVDRDRPPVLSFAQERFWFLQQLEPENPAYNLPGFFRALGPLPLRALRSAVATITARHENLRMRFPSGADGRAAPRIDAPSAPTTPVVDLRRLDAATRESEAKRRMRAEVGRPFDLAREAVFRMTLLRLAEEEHWALASLHHIAADGWSYGVLSREIATAIEAFASDRRPELPPLRVQYADYAAWQRERLIDLHEEQAAYWHERLAEVEPLELPVDRPRPAVQSYGGAVVRHGISPPLRRLLEERCRIRGATLFAGLLTAWSAVLHRLTGQESFCVGTAVAGRRLVELEPLIGCFVNTLALRPVVRGDQRSRESIDQNAEIVLSALAHQDVPFERLVAELEVERDLSRSPVFQTLLVLQNTPHARREETEADENEKRQAFRLEPLTIERRFARFDLSLDVQVEEDEGLEAVFELNSDLFDRTTILRWARSFERMLEAIAEDSERSFEEISMLSSSERHQSTIEWAWPTENLPKEIPSEDNEEPGIHLAAWRRAAETPDKIAVAADGRCLSYAALVRRAEVLASRLGESRFGVEDVVAVCSARTPEMLVALLGVHAAGCAYLPLDPSLPSARLEYLLRDSGAKAVLVHGLSEDFVEGLSGVSGVPILRLVGGSEIRPGAPHRPHPKQLAYSIYTSGSTGRPKGVLVPHDAAAAFLRAMAKAPGLEADDRLLAVTTLAFDISVLELFLPLQVGARIELLDRAAARDGEAVIDALQRFRATILQAVPATWRLLTTAEKRAGSLADLHLKALCGGEALPPDLAAELLPRTRELWNLYGPTETTVWSTRTRLRGGRPTIGLPIEGTNARIYDHAMRPAAIGRAGELCLGGAGVTRGYRGRAAVTAERFVPDPLESSGSRAYRTGDRARLLADGRFEYLGRFDHQLKLRGYRVEPGEIEAALTEHASLRQAAVVFTGGVLTAFYVGEAVDAGALRDFLRASLPEYMTPQAYVREEALPRTGSGKIDRRELMRRVGEGDAVRAGREYVAPRNPAEGLLAEIWISVLNLQRVGVHDDFFAVGGNSLLSLEAVARMREVGVEISPQQFFEHPTIAQAARFIDGATAGSSSAVPRALVALSPAGDAAPFFCFHAAGGTIFNLVLLARRIEGVPFYALQDPGLFDDSPHGTLEEATSRYLAEIREVRPHGPYLLGGHSTGGVYAFEAARRLTEMGEEVALVALFDTEAPKSEPPPPDDDEDVRVLVHVVRAMAAFEGAASNLSEEDLVDLKPQAQIERVLAEVRDLELFSAGLDERGFTRFLELFKAHNRAVSHYAPPQQSLPLTLFRARDEAGGGLGDAELRADPSLGWARLTTKSVEVVEVPGDHTTILSEHVEALAQDLRRVMP